MSLRALLPLRLEYRKMIEMIQAKHAFSANITVVKFAQDMWKSLLDLQTR